MNKIIKGLFNYAKTRLNYSNKNVDLPWIKKKTKTIKLLIKQDGSSEVQVFRIYNGLLCIADFLQISDFLFQVGSSFKVIVALYGIINLTAEQPSTN